MSKRRFIGRFTNYISYFLSACYAGLRLDGPDVVVALTDPPIVGLAALLASRRFRVPFVMSYRDIFPEVGVLLEDFHSPAVNWVLTRVNRYLVRKADRSIALGGLMRKRLIEGKGADPVQRTIAWACQAGRIEQPYIGFGRRFPNGQQPEAVRAGFPSIAGRIGLHFDRKSR